MPLREDPPAKRITPVDSPDVPKEADPVVERNRPSTDLGRRFWLRDSEMSRVIDGGAVASFDLTAVEVSVLLMWIVALCVCILMRCCRSSNVKVVSNFLTRPCRV
jgi:hypothetical protein